MMPTAIEQIVDVYVRLGNRRALENLRMLRQRLAVGLAGRAGYDFSLPVRQLDEEIAVIDAGLASFHAAEPAPFGTIRKIRGLDQARN